MPLPPPPAKPACGPDTSDLFDHEWAYSMALALCQECPVRDWCLRVVDPARNFYDGVAGGAVWREGTPRDQLTDPRRNIAVVKYLTRLNRLHLLPHTTGKKNN